MWALYLVRHWPSVSRAGNGDRLRLEPDRCSKRLEGPAMNEFFDPKTHVLLKAAGALGSQSGGSHYLNLPIQPIQYIHANKLDFLAGNVVKYVTRHKAKNGAADIQKAIHYCQLILELEYGQKEAK